MDEMTIAYVNPQIIKWAVDRCGLSLDRLATKAMTAESILAWMNGENHPTEVQAEQLAKKLRIPYLILFLDSIPNIDVIKLPDLRTVGGNPLMAPSINFIDILNDVMLRQDWFRGYQIANGIDRLSFVGKFSLNDSPEVVAGDMRAALGLTKDFRDDLEDWEDLVKGVSRNAEKLGILVMRSGFVGHANTRTLEVKEFRGFALSDPLAPVVFVNSRDSIAAQNFTLAHELAHIWIGQSGISNVNMNADPSDSQNQIERFCNRVAAELLVPTKDFRRLWNGDQTLSVNVRRITSTFKVSSLVALLRALENQAIQYPAFKSAFDKEARDFEEQEKREDDKPGQRGQFWHTFPWRVSHLLGQAIVKDVRRERTTYSEAARLLRINVSAFESYFQQESGG